MKYKKLEVDIPAGGNSFTQVVPFEEGYNIIGVMFKKIKGDTDKEVNIEFQTRQGSTIIDPMEISFIEKSTDGFKISTALPMPPGITTTAGLRVIVKSDNVMNNDYKGQLLFLLEIGAAMDGNGKVVPEEEMKQIFCKK